MTVSVIMSIYSERIEWIKEAIDSILNQTFSDFEFIIINDNPGRRENEAILSEYLKKDSRIRVVTNEENIGLTKSLNKGLSVSEGKYIARMDADDISHNTRFEKQINFLEVNPDYIVCGANISYFGKKERDIIYSEDSDEIFMFLDSPFAHPSVMFRNHIVDNEGIPIRYNESFRYAQDYELWTRLFEKGKFHNIQEILLKYRITSQQVSKYKAFEQQNYAGQLRREMFNRFCEQKGSKYILDEVIDLPEIKRYKKEVLGVNIWGVKEKKALNQFKHYLYRSVTKDSFASLFYMFYSLDFLELTPLDLLKSIYYLTTKRIPRLIQ